MEEPIFRGYAIERLEELTGSRILAGAASLAVSVLAHLAYWGWGALLGVAAVGLILTILYQWPRDLIANMIAHFLIDVAQLLL